MAFIHAFPVLRTPRSSAALTATTTMVHAPVSRRTALRLAAFSFAAVATSALGAAFDMEELKEDVEELDYEEEVLDVGPDAQEKNITRIKKKSTAPEYRVEETELLKEEEKKFDAMVAKEAAEQARIKAQFSKAN